VRIVTPKCFVRYGYPLTSEILLATRGEEVHRLLCAAWMGLWQGAHSCQQAKVLAGKNSDPFDFTLAPLAMPEMPQRVAAKLEQAVCSYLLHLERWGGNERKIYEEEYPELAGVICEVAARRFVQTGEYERGHFSRSYDGDGDWEPPYLGNAHKHCIYEVVVPDRALMRSEIYLLPKVEVLASNCERAS